MKIYRAIVIAEQVILSSKSFRTKNNAYAALGFTMCKIKDEMATVVEWKIQSSNATLFEWLFL